MLATILTSLPNVSLILSSIIRFRLKISFIDRGTLESISWRALSPVQTTKSTLSLKCVESQLKVALTRVKGASHSLGRKGGGEGLAGCSLQGGQASGGYVSSPSSRYEETAFSPTLKPCDSRKERKYASSSSARLLPSLLLFRSIKPENPGSQDVNPCQPTHLTGRPQ